MIISPPPPPPPPHKNITSSSLYEKKLLELIQPNCSRNQYKYHPNSNKIAVIIDPRYDELMKSVIYNFMYYMDPHGWNCMVMTHSKYKHQLSEDFPELIYCEIDEKLIYYENITTHTPTQTTTEEIPNISIYTYNKILMSKKLWNSIPAEHIAIFQKDCIMFKMFDEEFLKYDFAGANVHVPHTKTFFNGTVNGGFSLRKKTSMLDCLERVSLDNINIYIKKMKDVLPKTTENLQIIHEYEDTINEDVFFTFSCEILQKTIPDKFQRKRLAIEFEMELYYNIVDFYHKPENQPAVYHGWNKNYHDTIIAEYMLSISTLFSTAKP